MLALTTRVNRWAGKRPSLNLIAVDASNETALARTIWILINNLFENCIVTVNRPSGERVCHGLDPIMSQTKFHIEPPSLEGERWEVLKSIANHPKVYWIVARVATEAQAQAIVERLKANQAA